jgi:hypothetical protein
MFRFVHLDDIFVMFRGPAPQKIPKNRKKCPGNDWLRRVFNSAGFGVELP